MLERIVMAGLACAACSRPAPAVTSDAPSDVAVDVAVDAMVDAAHGIATDPHVAVSCLAVDATNVYWSSGFVPSYVWKAPTTPGAQATMLAMDPVEHACVMAIDAHDVYWVNGMEETHGVPLGGGSISTWGPDGFGYVATNDAVVITSFLNNGGELWMTERSTGATSQINPDVYALGFLAVDATYIYFSGRLHSDGPGFGNMVARVPLTSGFNPTLEILHTAPTGYLIGAVGYYYGGAFGVARSDFAVDASNLYVIETDGTSSDPNAVGNLVQIPLAGGSPIPLVTGAPGLLSVAVDATDVYWSALDGSDPSANAAPVKRIPIGGGATTTVTPQSSGTFAVGPTAIVWSTPGVIELMPKP